MISALVLAAHGRVPVSASPEAIARTLASLVPGVIDGFIRDVVLASLAGAPQAREIADHAGCALVEAGTGEPLVSAGLKSVRCDRVFILKAGFAPAAGFLEEAVDIFSVADAIAPRAALLRSEPADFIRRLFPAASPVQGMIVRARDVAKDAAHFEDVRRNLKAQVTLRCRMRRVA